MSKREKETHSKQKKISVGGILLVIALLGAMTGGAVAYLSTSTNSVENNFETAIDPSVAVNEDNSIKIDDPGYAVYLRAAVVVNWKNADHILADIPVEGTNYEIKVGDNWKKIGSFYYYQSVVTSEVTTAPVVKITELKEKKGYKIAATVAAQAIQAVGTTDEDEKTAIEDAWGVAATDFLKQ